MEKCPEDFGDHKYWKNFVYDCGANFYSAVTIPSIKESKTWIFNNEDILNLPSEVRRSLGNAMEVEATILPTEVVNIGNLADSDEERSEAAIQFLEILSSQYLTKE